MTKSLQTRCLLCSLMCRISAEVEGGDVRRFDYLEGAPPCSGKLCARGHYLKEIYCHPKRLVGPEIRSGEASQGASWNDTLKQAKEQLSQVIKAKGAKSIGVVISGNASCEEAYLANLLAREVIGTNIVSSSASLEDYNLMEGLEESSLKVPEAGIGYLDKCDNFLVIGNVFHRHPPVASFIQSRKYSNRRKVKVVVVDSSKSATTWFADIHLQPRPGTEGALFVQMALAMYGLKGKKGVPKQALPIIELLSDSDLPSLEEITGVSGAAVASAAEALCAGKKGAVAVTGGFAALAGGIDTVNALKLVALLGGVDREIVSLFTYANSLGVYEVTKDIIKSTKSGKDEYIPLTSLYEALQNRDLHGLLVFGEDIMSLLPSAGLKEAVEDLDFLLCTSSFTSDTSEAADIVLPRAAWFERGGCVLDDAGKVEFLEAVCAPPGTAKADEEILSLLIDKLKGRKSVDVSDDLTASVKDLLSGGRKTGRLTKKAAKEMAEHIRKKVGALKVHGEENKSDFLLVPELGAIHFADGMMSRRFSWPSRYASGPDLYMNRDDAVEFKFCAGDKVKVESAFGAGEFTIKLTDSLLRGVVSSSGHFPQVRTLFAARMEQLESGALGIGPEEVSISRAG